VTIDFVLGLPLTAEPDNYDTVLSVTDKFSKRITLLPGRSTYSAEDWAKTFLNGLVDWEVPKAIISDRDPKFLSAFWKAAFRALRTALLTSTVYHPQTDGQSQRTNQTGPAA